MSLQFIKINMEEQEKYNKFCKETDINLQHILSGRTPQKVEIKLLDEINPKTLLDIGCGTGNRMFRLYESKKILFRGIEKFKEIIDKSNFSNKIFCLDICDTAFKRKFVEVNDIEHYDLIVLFGVIQGFLDENLKKNAWKNISDLVNIHNYLIVNTISSFDWFYSNLKGQIVSLPLAPPQYFYSYQELLNLFKEHNLIILKEIDERHPYFVLKYFVLKK